MFCMNKLKLISFVFVVSLILTSCGAGWSVSKNTVNKTNSNETNQAVVDIQKDMASNDKVSNEAKTEWEEDIDNILNELLAE